MPRSPLLARLLHLRDTARASHATGIPVDELLDGAPLPARPLSRRDALAWTAAGAGLALAGCADPRGLGAPLAPPAAARGGSGGPRVAVIGAGLAGLTAAWRLRQQGVVATVYEASTRLGGRCWTRRDATFAGGQIAERGGELIDQSHTTIRQLAQELGLPLDNVLAAEPNGSEAILHFDGVRYSARAASDDMKALWSALHRDYNEASYPTLYTDYTARGRQLDQTSIRSWIAQTVRGGLDAPFGQLLDVAYTIEYGAETHEQSALNLIYLLGGLGPGQVRLFGASNEKYKVRGGNDRIVSELAARLDGQLRTGMALERLGRNSAGAWTLAFENGQSAVADRVVLALPFSMLKSRVAWAQVGFPKPKRDAIEQLGMGRNAKLQLQFTDRHWHGLGCGGDSFADTGYQATWEATRAQGGAAGILVNYTGGLVTDAQTGKGASMLATQFLDRIDAPAGAKVMPGLKAKWNKRVAFDDWPAERWVRGSYSYYRPGQYTAFGGAEAEAVGSCHFAGEHTSTDAQGYLEGAVESGARAAREVLAGLGVVPKA